MSVLRMEAFSQYEGDVTQLTTSNAGWAAVHSSASLVVGAGRDGGDVLRIAGPSSDFLFNAGARITLPSAKTEAFVQFAYSTPQLPSAQDIQGLLWVWTVAGVSAPIFHLSVNPAGAIEAYDGAGTLLGTSAAGVVTVGAKLAIAVHFKIDAATGEIEVRINQESKLHLTNLNLGSTGASLLTFMRNILSGGFPYSTDLMDVFINDTTGSENNTWAGDPRLVFLRARADYAPEQGWAAQRRTVFGTGVLSIPSTTSGIYAADASAMRVGSGDFTVETFAHFTALPTANQEATFFAKWLETGDKRSWRLFYGGSAVNSNHLELQVSTDGTAATVTSPISVSWTPIVGREYHIALQVASGKATLFIDGVRQNAPQTMPVPADNTSVFAVGGKPLNALVSFTSDRSFLGYFDEVRFTKGVARYGSGFTVPSAAFGRNSIDDPDYASVVLLAGFDSSIVDESASPRTLTAVGSAARYAPDDAGPSNYKVITHGDRSDTYLEASFLAASAIQTYTVNPSDGDTVTADSVTYTFKSPFVDAAGNVAVGATIDDSINNLVAALNGDAGAGTLYGTGTTPSANCSASNRGLDQLFLEDNTLGSAGNSVAVASSNASNPWSAATLTGGTDLPSPASFVLDRLPSHTTAVLAAALIHRSAKTDSGSCNVQPSLVVADGSSANGTDQALTTNFVFYSSLIEVDPSTMAGLTPSSFINARIRLDRTA